MESQTVLDMKGITKVYPGVKALDKVDFSVEKGSVHALMGENGAGKSTLIKVLTGVIQKDGGTVVLDGEPVEIHNVYDANNKGISAVYQELDLIPELSVCENVFLGREFLKGRMIDWKKTKVEAENVLKSMGISLDVTQKLSSLSTAMQQMVSIARAISIQSKIVVLDEPTSSLDTSEVEVLFGVIRKLKSQGIAVILITHRLNEVFEMCDTVTILKDGCHVYRGPINQIDKLQMVSMMIGRNASEIMGQTKAYKDAINENSVFLEGENLVRKPKVLGQNIKLHKGEVLGLAGLLGAGRTELARLLFGADVLSSGKMQIHGKEVKIQNPRAAIAQNIAFCSEDRKVEGIIPNMSIKNNIILASMNNVSKWGFISRKKQKELVEKYIKILKIKLSSMDDPIVSLSGGNQQKVLIARWLCTNPELLILDEPTRGIDVGAKKEILDKVCELADQGLSVLVISSILDELVQTCDRVQIIRDGITKGELSGEEISEEAIMKTIAKD